MPADNKNKVTVVTLNKKKLRKEPITMVSLYDYPSAQIAEKAGLDCLLVGDSAGMTVAGYPTTIPVTMDQMIYHAESVARGSKNCFLIGDFPFGSYQRSNEHAVENAELFIRAGMDAVKLEGAMVDRVKAVTQAGILCMSHIGLTPHTRAKFGGYRVQGKTKADVDKLVEQAKRLEEAGCFAILLEAVPCETAAIVRENVNCIVVGIGAGDKVDGQLVIFHDLVGLFSAFKSKFVKRYLEGGELIEGALRQYVNEVKHNLFPEEEHFYKIKDDELEKLLGDNKWKYEAIANGS